MRFASLISGGKDSCLSTLLAICEGHELVVLINLHPAHQDTDELDSYMYQTVGHNVINFIADACDLPLIRKPIKGRNIETEKYYKAVDNDEVEDLFDALKKAKENFGIQAVCSGAMLSDYQRTRVESVCSRLGLTSLAYLWRADQYKLFDCLEIFNIDAIMIKCASLGLLPDVHLGKSLLHTKQDLLRVGQLYQLNVFGEGGEFETLTLDSPLYSKKMVIDGHEVIRDCGDDDIAPVAHIRITKAHLEKKPGHPLALEDRIKLIRSIKTPEFLKQPLPPMELFDVLRSEQNIIHHEQQDALEQIRSFYGTAHSRFVSVDAVLRERDDVSSATNLALKSLSDQLIIKYESSLENVCLLKLFLADLRQFSFVNEIYSTFFHDRYPPRVCVQVDLPPGVAFRLFAYLPSSPESTYQEHMHVRSLSYWAPANIGPYSQALKTSDVIYVAGQIAMNPATLLIDYPNDLEYQCILSLRHVSRILNAMNVNKCPLSRSKLICYVTNPNFVQTADRILYSMIRHELTLQGQAATCTTLTKNIAEPVFMIVAALPKLALVEWECHCLL